MISKGLIKNMVESYDGSQNALNFYLSEPLLSEESTFTTFMHFV
jgi:hypothetical protein